MLIKIQIETIVMNKCATILHKYYTNKNDYHESMNTSDGSLIELFGGIVFGQRHFIYRQVKMDTSHRESQYESQLESSNIGIVNLVNSYS